VEEEVVAATGLADPGPGGRVTVVAPYVSAGARRGRSPAEPLPALHHVALVERTERALGGGPTVEVVGWPEDAGRLAELRRLGLARLVLVAAGADPLVASDDLEDWVRLPADDRDVRARLLHLRHQARAHPTRPLLDGSGRLIYDGRWVAVSRIEERLCAPLVERFGDVVPYDDLIAAAWPAGGADRALLRPRVSGLRRRADQVGLALLSVRGVGHVLQHAAR
jgi:two-component system, OmpR family, response regulator